MALALVVIPVGNAFAATSQDVTVTATPSYICIVVAPSDYNIGGAGVKIAKATTYYSKVGSETVAPSATVLDAECAFTITNTSTVATNITVNFPHFTGGDAMQNIDTGYTTNGANAFGASGYVSGLAWPGGAVILKNTGSAALISSLGATTNKKFGFAIKTQSGDWTSGDAMTSVVTVTATAA